MPRRRKKSSVYLILVALTIIVATYVYKITQDLILTLLILLIGVALVFVNR